MVAKIKHLDILIDGTNFMSCLLALGALKSGLKVGILKPLMLKHAYVPEISNFYPSTISESSKALKDVQFLMKCSSLFPHLYFPQRVLSLNENNKINPGFNLTIDKLLGRDRESASLPVNTSKYPVYRALSDNYSKGTLVYEYCFDRNRAIFELLKLNLQNGAEILDSDQDVECKLRLTCQNFRNSNVQFGEKDLNTMYPNTLKVRTSSCDLFVLKAFDHFSIQIRNIRTTSLNEFVKDVKSSLDKLKLNSNLIADHKLKERFEFIVPVSEQWIVEDPELGEQRTYFLMFQKRISAILNVNIDQDKLFDSWKAKSISGDNFRNIQNECDEKFDLAKQTGIEYHRFFHIFYRYRYHIDMLIDEAYLKMNEQRNPQIIWDGVLSSFFRSEETAL